jgi:cytochrome P450
MAHPNEGGHQGRCVVPFDHNGPEYAVDPVASLAELRRHGPLVYSSEHGGFWVPTTYEGINSAARNPAAFSSERFPAGSPYLASTIPQDWPIAPFIPLEMDPPEHAKFRQQLASRVSPAACLRLKPLFEEVTTYCIDRVIESGECDFMLDISAQVSALVTLLWLGLPTDDWERFAEIEHAVVAFPSHAPEFIRAVGMQEWKFQLVDEVIRARRKEPKNDFISYIVQLEIGGAPITDGVASNVVGLFIIAGIDTTASLVGQALAWLEDKPDLQRQLCQDDSLLTTAVEEFLRYFSPSNGHARTVKTDTEFEGQEMRAGERVFLCWTAANHDPEAFDNPERVILDRTPNRHAAFGLGEHTCAGNHFARVESQVVLPQILRRMRNYRIDRTVAHTYPSRGLNSGWSVLPGTFDPGPRLGSGVLPVLPDYL